MSESYALVLEDDVACGDHIELTLFLPFFNIFSESVKGTASEIIGWFKDLSCWISLDSLIPDHLVLYAKTLEEHFKFYLLLV